MAAGKVAALDSLGEFELVGVAGSPLEAGGLAALTQPDVALVDVDLQGGAEAALDEILSASPDTRVLACSGVSDHDAVTGMLRAGASGSVVRDAPADKLAAALRGAARERHDPRRRERPRAAPRAARPGARDEPRPRGARPQARSDPLGDGARRARHRLPADRRRWTRARSSATRPCRASPRARSAARPSGSPRRTTSGWAWSSSCSPCGWPASARACCPQRHVHGGERLARHGGAARTCSSCSTARTWTTWSSR